MKFSVFAIILFILGVFYSASFLIFPTQFMDQFGIHLDPAGASIGRLFGGAIGGYAISSWLVRNQSPVEPFARAVLVSTLFFNLVCLVVTVNSILNNQVNSMAWSTVSVSALIALASIYFLIAKKKQAITT